MGKAKSNKSVDETTEVAQEVDSAETTETVTEDKPEIINEVSDTTQEVDTSEDEEESETLEGGLRVVNLKHPTYIDGKLFPPGEVTVNALQYEKIKIFIS